MTVKHTDFTSQEAREQLALLIYHLAASQGTVMALSTPERREAVVNHAIQGALAVSLEVHQSEELVSLVLRMGGREVDAVVTYHEGTEDCSASMFTEKAATLVLRAVYANALYGTKAAAGSWSYEEGESLPAYEKNPVEAEFKLLSPLVDLSYNRSRALRGSMFAAYQGQAYKVTELHKLNGTVSVEVSLEGIEDPLVLPHESVVHLEHYHPLPEGAQDPLEALKQFPSLKGPCWKVTGSTKSPSEPHGESCVEVSHYAKDSFKPTRSVMVFDNAWQAQKFKGAHKGFQISPFTSRVQNYEHRAHAQP